MRSRQIILAPQNQKTIVMSIEYYFKGKKEKRKKAFLRAYSLRYFNI